MSAQRLIKEVPSSRSDQVFQTLEQRILAWDYPPGYHLKEDELCREFEVSRIPVREALGRLNQIHLVERKQNVGCTVKRWSLDELNDLYELRIALETYVAEALATNSVEKGTFDDLKKEWQQYLKNARKGEFGTANWGARDEFFHESLATALGNRQIVSALKDINSRLRFLRVKDITTLHLLKVSSEQHLAIIEAILSGNADKAKTKVRENIQTGKGNVKAALQDVLLRAFEV